MSESSLFPTSSSRNQGPKRSRHLLDSTDSLLFFVDIQERFRDIIPGMETVIAKSKVLLQAANRLKIPVGVSEQYPKALGSTVAELQELLQKESSTFGKMSFSSVGCEGVMDFVEDSKKLQVVVAGVEAHVCILQTALDLAANRDLSVFVVADAIASRNPLDKEIAMNRLMSHGVELVTTEMVVFEWLKKAGTAEFKELQKLIL